MLISLLIFFEQGLTVAQLAQNAVLEEDGQAFHLQAFVVWVTLVKGLDSDMGGAVTPRGEALLDLLV